jgi:arylsulfatase A-like enzyme
MPPKDSPKSERPNVILIMSDQHRADALGCMGNSIVKTPHFDRLAEGGVVFENAFVQCPVCMASRAAIHTGRYPRTIKVRSMGLLPPTEITLAETLKRAGYVTGMFGKLHFTPQGYTNFQRGIDRPIFDAGYFLEPTGILSAANLAAAADPFKKDYGFDVSYGVEDLVWGTYLDWLEEEAPEHVPAHVSENWGSVRGEIRYGSSPPAKRMFHPDVSDFFDSRMPSEIHPSTFLVDRALEFIKANREKPFFVHCSFVDPHHPFNAPRPFNALYRPDDMPTPPPLDAEEFYPPHLPEPLWAQITKTGRFPDDLWRWGLANYYGMISHIDWCVGRLLKGVDDLGLENTLILFTADHGEYIGDHRMLYKGSLMFDGEIRVPLIASWPGRLKSPRRIEGMCAEIDIYPTIMSLLGLPIHPGVQGRDLSKMLLGGKEEGCERIFCELDRMPLAEDAIPSQTIRRADWKLNYFPLTRQGLLFHLKEDPEERHNLYTDPAHARIRHELMMDIADFIHASGDPLPIRLSGS